MFSLPVLIARGLDLQSMQATLLHPLFSFQGTGYLEKIVSKPSEVGLNRKERGNEADRVFAARRTEGSGVFSDDVARWSSGQDGGLSRPNREFDSPTGHHMHL